MTHHREVCPRQAHRAPADGTASWGTIEGFVTAPYGIPDDCRNA